MNAQQAEQLQEQLAAEIDRLGGHQRGPYLQWKDGDPNRAQLSVIWSPSALPGSVNAHEYVFTRPEQVEAWIANGCRPSYALPEMGA